MSGEQVRWGYENLALDQKKLDSLGFAGVMRPISTSCADHRGAGWARVHTWSGKKWEFSSGWYESNESIIKPMVRAAADKYAAEKKIERRLPQVISVFYVRLVQLVFGRIRYCGQPWEHIYLLRF